MNLDSCRELKKTVLGRAYRAMSETQQTRRYLIRKARSKAKKEAKSVEPEPVAAIGVAPWEGKKRGYKLAVRVFRGHERNLTQLLKGLERHRAEVDLVTGIRYKPRLTVRAGGSAGHFKITAGTLGGFVEDASNYYMLSNNHVFANSNQCFESDPIVQPGPSDITSSFDIIGRLHAWFPLSRSRRDGVDAAIARFTDEVDFFEPWNYAGIGTIQRRPVSNRFSVSRVIKRGRTTGVTRGTVSAFELDGVSINYGTTADPAVVTFDDQIEVIGSPPSTPFSQPGDSGSFIIDRDTMRPYALLYGGGEDSAGIDRTLAHFMPEVLSKMNVRLVQ